jgi:hypothetical protein
MKPSRLFVAIAWAAVAVACGAEPEARSPEAAGGAKSAPPSNDQDRSTAQSARPQDQAPPPPPTAPGSREYAQPPGQTSPQAPGDPWLEFQSARSQMEATTSDCAVACKALASIDRATGHVCAMATASDHCTSARETLKTARKKVRAECTVCPQGPSVDPDGPIPSVP